MLTSKLSREPSVTGKTAGSSSRESSKGEQQGSAGECSSRGVQQHGSAAGECSTSKIRPVPAPAPATGSTSRVRGAQVSSSRSGEQQSRLW